MYLAKVNDLIKIGKDSNNVGRTMNDNINICVSDAPKYVNIDDLFALCENDRFNMYCLGRTARMYITEQAKEYKEFVHAKWLVTEYYDCHKQPIYQCTNCNNEVADEHIDKHKFCLHCGAKMDGEKK